ncbi:cordon-bleu protein-like 1 isoform X3 [Macrosteles quadrilineatus]|uniref:cordon-bleu protein-like 1 isoform X3 n=1 Tax=Macrosteles quadrilineatus TaxID=74068 RepID=UPI0023E1BFE2|nr:cordon-bleu protein-like 1 isoform X3 [Macrosteles quadrilineatus]
MMMTGGLTVTEDTPPDMLAGSMDLAVVLPDGHSLKMSVERSTPMMDLLVQVTTANKISSPAGFILKPLNERGPLPYKPSTPIGALDAWTIHVVPKQLGQCPAIKKPLKTMNQPFEQTFRLQVHLPRNQLYVARVSPKTRLSDILQQVCSEKNLDPLKYSLRHPVNLDQVLSLQYTLGDYKLQEVTLVCNKTRPVEVSSVDIMSLQRETTNPAYRNTKCEGSVSSGSLEGRSLSPVPSDESSASPPLNLPPSRPIRKRRPAPKPPTILQKSTIIEKQVNGLQPSTVINHSRNSSDSSGYHEASVLSESPQNNNVPESRTEAGAPLTVVLSQSMTDVSAIPSRPLQNSTSCNSISSLTSTTGSATGRKKKSAPPPPPVAKDAATSIRSPSVSSTASSTTTLDGNDLNTTAKSATLPPSTRLNTTLIPPPPSVTPPPTPTTPPVAVEPSVSPRETDAEMRLADEEIDRIFSNATENHTSPEIEEDDDAKLMMSLPSPVMPEEVQPTSGEDQLNWEYRLPAPPTFRDENKSPSVTEFGTVTIGNLSEVVCSQTVKEDQPSGREIQNVDTVVEKSKINEEKFINSVEAAPTINSADLEEMRPLRKEVRSSSASSIYDTEASKSSRSSIHSVEQEVINELSSTLHQRSKMNPNENVEKHKSDLINNSTLDNFTITTYKDTKPIEVFEDDSIKSSTGEKRDKSKDDAVFRAPKPRFKEPNLSRTNSFSVENNQNGPVIKRSVSYVSLLAANMPRNSQPYRAHLQRHRSSVGQELDFYPRLRKTSSEVNIDRQDNGKENTLWQDDSTQLQSVQVLRNILSRSHANLSSSIEETDSIPDHHTRDSPPPSENFMEESSKSSLGRSQSEEDSKTKKTPKPVFDHASSLGDEPAKTFRGPPSINLSTWSERPKRQISIKNDGEYISGFGKKPNVQDVLTSPEKKEELHSSVKAVVTNPSLPRNDFASSIKNESYKLEEKSKSISDLSRIPIVRSVELKKPYVNNNYDQTRLKHVEQRDEVKNYPHTEDVSKASGEEEFIGVNTLARRFGVPQKRPVSEYYGTQKFKDLQSTVDASARHNLINNGPAVVSVSTKVNNTPYQTSEPHLNNIVGNNKTDSTTEVKAQSKIRSGGAVDHPPFSITLKRTVSQPSHINSVLHSEPTQTSYFNTIGAKQSNISSVSISSSVDQKIPSSSIYIKQSQTLDRKFPVNIQPVVKGFRVPTEMNSNSSLTVNSSSAQNDSSNALNNSVNSFTVHKSSAVNSSSAPKVVSNNVSDSSVNSFTIHKSSTTNASSVTKDASKNLSNSSVNSFSFQKSPAVNSFSAPRVTNNNLPSSSVNSFSAKSSYSRTFSTPSISVTAAVKDRLRDDVDNVRLRSSSTSISQAKAEVAGSIPPPPPMMPMLKPVGERKGVKFLPPPTADPRDLLMESIRSFGKDSLKKV